MWERFASMMIRLRGSSKKRVPCLTFSTLEELETKHISYSRSCTREFEAGSKMPG